MSCGLYGKLPAKRDFIAHNLPAGFLARWEPWLQGSLSEASLKVGPSWKERFFTAPLWRFWLGRDILGYAAVGVLMPSADGVGRQFPLCLVAAAPQGDDFASLLQDARAEWLNAAEEFLLSTLDEGQPFEATLAALAAIAPPECSGAPGLPSGVQNLGGSLVAQVRLEDATDAPLQLLAETRRLSWSPKQTMWWTIGGEGFPPLAIVSEGLPGPAAFLSMFMPPQPDPVVTEQAAT